jgi:hypothetical protein
MAFTAAGRFDAFHFQLRHSLTVNLRAENDTFALPGLGHPSSSGRAGHRRAYRT